MTARKMGQRTRAGQRGMALVATMLVLMGIMALMLLGMIAGSTGSSGVITTTTGTMTLSAARMRSTTAFSLAESGVDYTVAWLTYQAGQNPKAIQNALSVFPLPATWTDKPGKPGGTFTLGGGTFSVTVYPSASNTQALAPKQFLVESTGTCNGLSQTVRAYVQQKPFSYYAYFTNVDPGNAAWFTNINTFDGPMHSNNADGVKTNIVWWNAAAMPNGPQKPMFTSAGSYETVASGVNWIMNLASYTAPSSAADWSDIAAAGQSAVHYGAQAVPFPTNNTTQQTAALGSASVPSSTGVVVSSTGGSTDGGVYIHGGVQQMTLRLDAAATSGTTNPSNSIQWTQVDQSLTTAPPGDTETLSTYVKIDPTAGTTGQTTLYTVDTVYDSNGNVVTQTPATDFDSAGNVADQYTKKGNGKSLGNKQYLTPTQYTGTTNGVVYADGNIGSQGSPKTGGLSGVVADNLVSGSSVSSYSGLTIATSAASNLNIDGSVTYHTARAKTGANYNAENGDTNFTTNAGTLGLVSNTIEVVDKDPSGNALTNVEVDGSVLAFNTFDATDSDTRQKGRFQSMGGYIANAAGTFANTDQYGNLYTGLGENYSYDARLATHPPPGFPTTANQFSVVSWQRVAAPLQ